MEVKDIQAQDTYAIRQTILAPQDDKDYYRLEHDHDELTFHLGCFVEKQLVSCASFYFEKNASIPDLYQYRVRGMATLPEHRGKGYGTDLLKTAFPIIIRNQCNVLWCHAREITIPFYEKIGFVSLGEKFQRPKTGTHQLMYKRLL